MLNMLLDPQRCWQGWTFCIAFCSHHVQSLRTYCQASVHGFAQKPSLRDLTTGSSSSHRQEIAYCLYILRGGALMNDQRLKKTKSFTLSKMPS